MRSFLLFVFALLVLLIALPLIVIIRLFSKTANERSAFFFLLAKNLDYTGGTLLYDSDAKTVSAFTGKLVFETNESKKIAYFERLINWLFNDDKHCFNAYVKEFEVI